MFREYPRHVHKAGGAFLVVEDETAQAEALSDGWSLDVVLEDVQAPPVPDVKRKPGRPKKLP